MESGVLKQEDLPRDRSIGFGMEVSVNGSSEFSFVPIGETTDAQIISEWETTSFKGNFFPTTKTKLPTVVLMPNGKFWISTDLFRRVSITAFQT